MDAKEDGLATFGLNEKHRGCVVSYLRFARTQRSQHLKSIDACLDQLKSSRLATDDTYTVDEVSEMLDSLERSVRAEIESELIFSAHTSVLLINQILRQVESQRATVSVDVFQLEDRQLLEQVSAFEQAELAGDDATSQTVRPAPLRLNSFDARLSDTQRIVSLSLEVQKLKRANEALREGKSEESGDNTSTHPEITTANTKLETLEAEIQCAKLELEKTSTALKMTESELEKKVCETTPFKNLKRMMMNKNSQINQLRARLAKYEDSLNYEEVL